MMATVGVPYVLTTVDPSTDAGLLSSALSNVFAAPAESIVTENEATALPHAVVTLDDLPVYVSMAALTEDSSAASVVVSHAAEANVRVPVAAVVCTDGPAVGTMGFAVAGDTVAGDPVVTVGVSVEGDTVPGDAVTG